jgi:hypothetical protein
VDSPGSGCGPVADSREHSGELSGSGTMELVFWKVDITLPALTE